MEQKEKVQIVYANFREDCGRDSRSCMEFLKWLHETKNELIYLKDMPGLTNFEIGYINELLEK